MTPVVSWNKWNMQWKKWQKAPRRKYRTCPTYMPLLDRGSLFPYVLATVFIELHTFSLQFILNINGWSHKCSPVSFHFAIIPMRLISSWWGTWQCAGAKLPSKPLMILLCVENSIRRCFETPFWPRLDGCGYKLPVRYRSTAKCSVQCPGEGSWTFCRPTGWNCSQWVLQTRLTTYYDHGIHKLRWCRSTE